MRHRADRVARFALVVWPDNAIGCLPLGEMADAETRGAFPFAVEWDVIDDWTPVILPAQSNPRRQADGDEGDGA